MILRVERAPHVTWRALAATATITVGATSAHAWAAGEVPHWSSVVGMAGLVLAASMLVLRGDLSVRVLLPALAAAQIAAHEALSGLDTAAGHGAHVHAAVDVAGAWSSRMLVAHAAVTALTAVVWRLCERAATAVVRLLEIRPVPGAGLRGRSDLALWPHARAWNHFVVLTAPRRGPPAIPRRV